MSTDKPVVREPVYSWWPSCFGKLDPQQRAARHAQEIQLRVQPPKIPTIFGELHGN